MYTRRLFIPLLSFRSAAMRVITLNVNGIRAAGRRGLSRWLTRVEPWDVVCLQELRAEETDVPRALRAPRKCSAAFHPAQRKGYAGVGLYAKPAATFVKGFGSGEFDDEGRYLRGGFRGTVRHQPVPAFRLERAAPAGVQVPLSRGVPAASCAASPKRNARSSCAGTGTSRTSRSILKTGAATRRTPASCPRNARGYRHVFDALGFVDVFRKVDPRPEQYTWWSNRGDAWAKNVGWRIDYQIATPGIAARAHAARDLQEPAVLRSRPVDHRLRLRTTIAVLRITNLTLARGTKRLLEGASLTVHTGHKVGTRRRERLRQVQSLRRNPAGVAPDAGSIALPPSWTIAHVAQETPAVALPAIEFVLDGDRELREVESALAAAERDPAHSGEALADLHHRFEDIGGYSARARACDAARRAGVRRAAARRAGAKLFRRLANAPQPRPGADVPLGPAAARRADQPPRPRRRAVARGLARKISGNAAADHA